MGDIFNILISAVRGQGEIVLGSLLREYGLKSPLIKKVVGTETSGVSRREGSIIATVRYLIEGRIYSFDQNYKKEDLISPLIPKGDAHIVIGLEPLETLRNLKYISEKTEVILNINQHFPRHLFDDSEKKCKYPSFANIINLFDQFARRVICMDFDVLSKERFGDSSYRNSIILGLCIKEFEAIFIKKHVKEIINSKVGNTKINFEALKLGYNLVR